MTDPSLRRFTIADAMILTVAGAVGSFLLREVWPGYLSNDEQLASGAVPGVGGLYRGFYAASTLGTCAVIPLMAALVVARLQAPRPRSIRDEPGFVAGLAVLVALLPGVFWYLSIRHRPGFREAESIEQAWQAWKHYITLAVPGAWMALVLGRRWCSRADWVDRSGRVLGWFWVVLFVAWKGVLACNAIIWALAQRGL